MLRKEIPLICFFILFFTIALQPIVSEQILLDNLDLTIDINNTNLNKVKITIYNLQKDDIKTLQILANKKNITDFTIKELKKNKVIGLIIDNSGSIILNDFYDILNKSKIFISNMSNKDKLIIWKVNDYRKKLYDLSFPKPFLKQKISSLVREGKKSRIIDALNESFIELNKYKNLDEYKNFNFYLVLFSDGEDIGSTIKKDSEIKETNFPFYYFSYISKRKKVDNEIYKRICDKTKGRVINRPVEDSIKKIFFQNETRYNISFYLNRKDIIKSKSFKVIIKRNKNDIKPLTIDLKHYLHNKPNYKINRFIFLLLLVLIIIIGIIFTIFFLLVLKKKKNNFLNKNDKKLNNINNSTDSNIGKKKELANNADAKLLAISTKEAIDITHLDEGETISYQERGIIYNDRAKVQREIEKSKKTYIDKPEHFGETIVVNVLLNIKDIVNGNLICKSKLPFFLDETLKLFGKKFLIIKIVYVHQGKNFIVTLQPRDEEIDLNDLFIKGKEITAKRVIKIFGSNDSIIEKIATQNYQNKKNEYSKPWRQATIITKGTNFIEIKSKASLLLDSIVVIKYVNGLKELFFRVKKVRMLGESSYKVRLIPKT